MGQEPMHRCDAQGASHLSHRAPRDTALSLRMTPGFDHLVLGSRSCYEKNFRVTMLPGYVYNLAGTA